MLATLQPGDISRGSDLLHDGNAVRRVVVSSHFSHREVGDGANPPCRTGQNSSPMPTVQPRMLGPNR